MDGKKSVEKGLTRRHGPVRVLALLLALSMMAGLMPAIATSAEATELESESATESAPAETTELESESATESAPAEAAETESGSVTEPVPTETAKRGTPVAEVTEIESGSAAESAPAETAKRSVSTVNEAGLTITADMPADVALSDRTWVIHGLDPNQSYMYRVKNADGWDMSYPGAGEDGWILMPLMRDGVSDTRAGNSGRKMYTVTRSYDIVDIQYGVRGNVTPDSSRVNIEKTNARNWTVHGLSTINPYMSQYYYRVKRASGWDTSYPGADEEGWIALAESDLVEEYSGSTPENPTSLYDRSYFTFARDYDIVDVQIYHYHFTPKPFFASNDEATWTIHGLDPGQSYRYRVRKRNDAVGTIDDWDKYATGADDFGWIALPMGNAVNDTLAGNAGLKMYTVTRDYNIVDVAADFVRTNARAATAAQLKAAEGTLAVSYYGGVLHAAGDKVYFWGSAGENNSGLFYHNNSTIGGTIQEPIPVNAGFGSDVVQIEQGKNAGNGAAVLTENGDVFVWGNYDKVFQPKNYYEKIPSEEWGNAVLRAPTQLDTSLVKGKLVEIHAVGNFISAKDTYGNWYLAGAARVGEPIWGYRGYYYDIDYTGQFYNVIDERYCVDKVDPIQPDIPFDPADHGRTRFKPLSQSFLNSLGGSGIKTLLPTGGGWNSYTNHSARGNGLLALMNDGRLFALGDNWGRELLLPADDTWQEGNAPINVLNLEQNQAIVAAGGICQIYGGDGHTVIQTQNGNVYGVGFHYNNSYSPVLLYDAAAHGGDKCAKVFMDKKYGEIALLTEDNAVYYLMVNWSYYEGEGLPTKFTVDEVVQLFPELSKRQTIVALMPISGGQLVNLRGMYALTASGDLYFLQDHEEFADFNNFIIRDIDGAEVATKIPVPTMEYADSVVGKLRYTADYHGQVAVPSYTRTETSLTFPDADNPSWPYGDPQWEYAIIPASDTSTNLSSLSYTRGSSSGVTFTGLQPDTAYNLVVRRVNNTTGIFEPMRSSVVAYTGDGALTATRAWVKSDSRQSNILSGGETNLSVDGEVRSWLNNANFTQVVELRNDAPYTVYKPEIRLTGEETQHFTAQLIYPSDYSEATGIPTGGTFTVEVKPKVGLAKGPHSLNLQVFVSADYTDTPAASVIDREDIGINLKRYTKRSGTAVCRQYYGGRRLPVTNQLVLSPANLADLSLNDAAYWNNEITVRVQWNDAWASSLVKEETPFGDPYELSGNTITMTRDINDTGQIGRIIAVFDRDETNYFYPERANIDIFVKRWASEPDTNRPADVLKEYTVIIPSETDTTIDLIRSYISGATVSQTQGLDGVTLGTGSDVVTIAKSASKGGEAHFTVSIPDSGHYIQERIPVTVYLLEKQEPKTLPDINLVTGQIPGNKVELPAIAGATYEITSGGGIVSTGTISPDSNDKYYVTLPSNLSSAGKITVTMTVPEKRGEDGEYKVESVITQRIVIRKPAEFSGTFLYEYNDLTKPDGAVTMDVQVPGAGMSYTLKSGGEILKNYNNVNHFTLADPTVYGKAVITVTSSQTDTYAAGSRDIEIYVRQANPAALKVQQEYTVIIPSATDIAPIDLTCGVAGVTIAQTQSLGGVTLNANGRVTIAKGTTKGGVAKFTATVPGNDAYEETKVPVRVYLLEKQAPKTLPDIDLVVGKITSNKIELPNVPGATYKITSGGGLITTGEITADADGKHYVTLPDSVTNAAQITVTMTVPAKKGEGGEYKTEAVTTQRIMIRKEAEFSGTFLYEYTDKTKPAGAVTMNVQVPGANMSYTLKSGGSILKDYNGGSQFTLADPTAYGKAVITVTSSQTDTYIAGSCEVEIYLRQGKPSFTGLQSEYTVIIPSETDIAPIDLTCGVAGVTVTQTQALGGVTLNANGQVTIAKETAKGGVAKFTAKVPASDEYEETNVSVTVYLLEKQAPKTLPDIDLVVGKITSNKIELPAIAGATYKITSGGGLVSTGAISPDSDGKYCVTLPSSVTDAAQITVTMTVPEKKGEGGEYKTEAVTTQRIMIRKEAEFSGTFLYEYTDETKPAGAVTMNVQVPGAGMTYTLKSGGEILKDYNGVNHFTLADPTAYGKTVITVTSSQTDTYIAGSREVEIYVRKPSDDKSKPFVTKDENGDFIITNLVPGANYDLTALSQKEFKEDPKNYFVLPADETGKIVIKYNSEDYKKLELDQEGVDDVLIRRSKTDDMLPSDPLPTSHGVTVSGVVSTFAPNRAGEVRLYPYNADGSEPKYFELHHTVYDTQYKCTFGGPDEPKNSEMSDLSFQIERVPAGTYLLVVVKPGNLHFVVKNLVVGNEDIDLTSAAYPAEVQSMYLIPGDLNSNGKVEANDSAILFRNTNWGQNASDAEVEACDLNGNGLVEANDSAILFRNTHWGKSDTKITLS